MAQQIALLYPNNKKRAYQNAADSLRAPFWDWASNSSLPDVATRPTISVCTYNKATKQEIPNPLYTYNYPVSASNGQFGEFFGHGSTKRCTATQGNPQLDSASLKSNVVSDGINSPPRGQRQLREIYLTALSITSIRERWTLRPWPARRVAALASNHRTTPFTWTAPVGATWHTLRSRPTIPSCKISPP